MEEGNLHTGLPLPPRRGRRPTWACPTSDTRTKQRGQSQSPPHWTARTTCIKSSRSTSKNRMELNSSRANGNITLQCRSSSDSRGRGKKRNGESKYCSVNSNENGSMLSTQGRQDVPQLSGQSSLAAGESITRRLWSGCHNASWAARYLTQSLGILASMTGTAIYFLINESVRILTFGATGSVVHSQFLDREFEMAMTPQALGLNLEEGEEVEELREDAEDDLRESMEGSTGTIIRMGIENESSSQTQELFHLLPASRDQVPEQDHGQ